ncbi:LOW QUALITY PROTEIN: uncharacterized protein ACR2FA_001504 [Aphomia sociella]
MPWWSVLLFLVTLTTVNAINRPVYKVVLAQKGFAQFIQYDVETPPLREFTFCTWIRIYDLEGDQTIFSYVANGNVRIVRLWLDSGGRHMKITINGRVTTSTPVDVVKDVWRHVCLSYQSDYGAWALYMDARLVTCEAAQSLYGFVLPGGGSIIIGYGTTDNGSPNGFEGEIFGTNMILTSTIERNYTIRQDPLYEQKKFQKNKIRNNEHHNNKYIILKDLQTDEIQNNFEKTQFPRIPSTSKSHIKFRTPHSIVDHDVGIELTEQRGIPSEVSNEQEIFDIFVPDTIHTTSDENNINFWNLVNQAEHEGKFKQKLKTNKPSNTVTRVLPTVSEYETPPLPGSSNYEDFFKKTLEMHNPAASRSIHKLNKHLMNPKDPSKKYTDDISEIETPPPPSQDSKVYGQWTSSKFAGSVLNYLKSINFNTREIKKIPPTISLPKLSDSFPYPSNFKITKLHPPLKFQRNNLLEKKYNINKRSDHLPQINVKILEDDLRSNIIKLHAQTKPTNVEVTNRGEIRKDHRFYRNVDTRSSLETSDSIEDVYRPRPFNIIKKKKALKDSLDSNTLQNNNLISILPFLKSLEYFIEDSEKIGSDRVIKSNDMYSKSLSNGNKWHNVKSYSNDYTPRRINVDSNGDQNHMDDKIADVNKRHPTIRLKYKHENKKLVETNDDPIMLKGRVLAKEVSNLSDYNKDSVSILKYNHGHLPGHVKINTNMINIMKTNYNQSMARGKNNFHKHVKIGNALNERQVLGVNDERKKQSFIGGDAAVPDINRYRSDIDKENVNVPSSLSPSICKNVELYDRVLYVQPDQSIDLTHILSPVRLKNIAIEFIQQNYKKCSLEDSTRKSPLLYIDWSKTPVRLFGGAYPRRTKDLCGFF